ncbi:hypothetical protein GGI35DRAFT_66923 [Trichoderma velutinum]
MQDGSQRRHHQETYQKIPDSLLICWYSLLARFLSFRLVGAATIYPWHSVTSLSYTNFIDHSVKLAFRGLVTRRLIARLAPSISFCPLILASSSSGINRSRGRLSNEERFIIYYCHFESGTNPIKIQSSQAKQAKPNQTRFLPFTMVHDASAIHGSPKVKSFLKTPHQQKTPKSLQLIFCIRRLDYPAPLAIQERKDKNHIKEKHTILTLIKTTKIAKTLRKGLKGEVLIEKAILHSTTST